VGNDDFVTADAPEDHRPGIDAEAEAHAHGQRPSDQTQPLTADKRKQRRRLPREAWKSIVKRTFQQFNADNLTDLAAALTYYAVLSIFPGLLVMISALRVFGTSTVDAVVSNISDLAPGDSSSTLTDAARTLQQSSQGSAVLLVIIGVVTALWSASGYVGAFMRASNAIYDVPEGRPAWKKLPVRVGLTVFAGVMLSASALIVIFTGRFASSIGKALHVGQTAVQVWDVAKWPVLVILISILFAVLYWASPNAKFGRFRWFSAGGVLAVVIWLIASGLFAFYVANFSSYNKVYGSLATIIIFLVWLWISNIAVLLGAEFDAEIMRERAIRGGMPADQEPYMELRDDRKVTADKPTG
jgi:membrane protein